MIANLQINHRSFIIYKFLNSLFTGLSIGAVFTIYKPLDPSVYSLGGILLAALMIIVATFYSRILNNYYFFRISLFVEIVLLAMVIYFLIFSYSYQTALLIYIGYQLSFVFGSYLVRVETLSIQDEKILTYIDMSKQSGYLTGLAFSFLFYKSLEYYHGVIDFDQTFRQFFFSEKDSHFSEVLVYNLHYLLVSLEMCIIYFLIRAFSKENK